MEDCSHEREVEDDMKAMHNYYKKYIALKKRCDSIHLGSERLVNRIYYIKKAIRKLSRERRALIATLDEYGDDCRNAPLIIAVEDDVPLSALNSSDIGADISDVSLDIPHKSKKLSLSPPLSLSSPSPTPVTTKPALPTPVVRKKKRKEDKPEKEKDPNAPKKPANAYLMFCQQERAPVQEEHQSQDKDEISHQELTKELAKRWNELTSDQKQAYYDMYEKDKLRYEREMQEYNSSFQSATNSTNSSSNLKPIKEDKTIASIVLPTSTATPPKIKSEKPLESAYSRIKMERQELAKLKMEQLEVPKPKPPPPEDYDPYNFDDEENKRRP
ncbi:HMG box-containing protein C28F2.11-like [Anneissia japonica]|uniref:HMG box-containing protein C28F2.11-like n=1 Tax=Anneissia japonica TaxID=1529436 RepID=UPI0014255686|nr:HMG box-containing protein C28F2.11-like [Anneissia japonica]